MEREKKKNTTTTTTTTHPTHTHTHSHNDAQIFFGSRASRSSARSVACTPLSLLPWLAFDVLPKMSSDVKERVFLFIFFYATPPPPPPPQTHTQTHISTHLAYEQDNLLSLTHPHPVQNRIRTSLYCYLVAGFQSP